MKTIFIDENFRCHLDNPKNNYKRYDIESFFDNKCEKFINGYIYIPKGKSYTYFGEDGEPNYFFGETYYPIQDFDILSAYQQQYEEDSKILDDIQNKQLNSYREGVNSL